MNALILGFGAIARALCTLQVPFNTLVIIDKIDMCELIINFFKDRDSGSMKKIQQVKFIKLEISKNNLDIFKNIIIRNNVNIVVDCSYNVDTMDLLKILPPTVSYINTSVEDWGEENIQFNRTLKDRQTEINKWYESFKPQNNILLDCGMNPGLISLWAFDCCSRFKLDPQNITQCIISEVDTQRAKIPRKMGEFVSTWSPDGFMEEVHGPIEGHSLGNYFVDNKATAYRTISKSLRPNGEEFFGYTVRHAETITMKKLFPNSTLMYIYKCPDEAISSLFEYQEPRPIASKRILYSNDIIDGRDEVGVLMTDGIRLVWHGSLLSNDDIKKFPMAQYINSTTYQVACGLWIGIRILKFCWEQKIYKRMTPEDIIQFPKFDSLLKEANKYLKMDSVEFAPPNDKTKKIIKNKSFQQHFVTKYNPEKNI